MKPNLLSSAASVAEAPAHDRVLTPREVRETIQVHDNTLVNWRIKGGGPPFVRLGTRRVGYPQRGFQRWLNEREVGSRAEEAVKRQRTV
ncbi:helix-turn-helix transcriptional regulator [Falsiroseomonas sp.]|uniref:helix-turn-helix transcriptional regulator n=1 Tax=Falsiroseomonas sp. TaxID=2870721 RepID=UPI003565A3AA